MRSNNIKILDNEYGSFRDEIQKWFRQRILTKASIILDPMSGTAPLIPFVETNGHKAYFNDILPIHFFINKAKTYQVFEDYQKRGRDWYIQQLLFCMANLKGKTLCISDSWIDDSILEGLQIAWKRTEQFGENTASLLRAIIVLCVRPLSSITKSKNPTWLKYGGMSSGQSITEIIEQRIARFDKYYAGNYQSNPVKIGECVFTDQSAAELKLTEKVDFILTSPPYCNRLDSMILYGPENYFLSSLGYKIRSECLVTTTKVKDYNQLEKDFDFLTSRSKCAHSLLTSIKKSPIPDDPGYYLKYYTRYFSMLFNVINNSLKNLSISGKIYIVTQDNTHRGELIEIDRVLRELFQAEGWHSKVVKTWERHHLGLRNVSRNHAVVRPKQLEKLTVMWQ